MSEITSFEDMQQDGVPSDISPKSTIHSKGRLLECYQRSKWQSIRCQHGGRRIVPQWYSPFDFFSKSTISSNETVHFKNSWLILVWSLSIRTVLTPNPLSSRLLVIFQRCSRWTNFWNRQHSDHWINSLDAPIYGIKSSIFAIFLVSNTNHQDIRHRTSWDHTKMADAI